MMAEGTYKNFTTTSRPIHPIREGIVTAILMFLAITISGSVIYLYALNTLKTEIREGILRHSKLVASVVNGDLHERFAELDLTLAQQYALSVERFSKVMQADPDIKYAYTCILRNGKVRFVINPLSGVGNAYRAVKPNAHDLEYYPDASEALLYALTHQTVAVTDEPYTDKWGTFISAYAPFYTSDGRFAGVVGVDVKGSKYQLRLKNIQKALLAGMGMALLFSLIVGGAVWKIRHHAKHISKNRDQLLLDMLDAKQLAESHSQAKSQFLANMSHELRTPMHAILSFSEFGLSDIHALREHTKNTKLPDDINTHFITIRDSGKRLLSLLNNLLDLSKLEAGKMELNKSMMDMRSLINSVCHELSPLAEGKHLALEINSESDNTIIMCDAGKITQVLYNLLSNAIKFSGEHKTIIVNCQDTTLHGTAALAVSILDSGVGIPEGELVSIFDKFIQSSKTKTGAGGTGLGLAICTEIITLHEGTIWAENRPEGGAQFTFILPHTV